MYNRGAKIIIFTAKMNTDNLRFKILLVEDDKQISSFLKDMFETRNHSITVINHGLEALKYLENLSKDTHDIILLDLNLPGANGWEILARIRSLPTIASIPVIMLTGADDDSTEARALYDGADDFIPKPCSSKVLLARIETNIRKKASMPALQFEFQYSEKGVGDLSEREKEILGFIVKGLSNKDIAEKAFISEQTVMNHVKSILKKLQVDSRIQAAIVALKFNLV